MSWFWIIAGAIVLTSALSISRYIRRAMLFFAIAFAGLMVIHLQHDPAEASAALATLGGGFALRRPLAQLFGKFPF
ncbi:MAG: hypothetical protein EBT13_09410 [Rhodobacteraceae bacterium]|nr:hypothetical protein [Paracoccaceae bacterium]